MDMSTEFQPKHEPNSELTPKYVSDTLEFLKPIRKQSRAWSVVLASLVAVGSILPFDIAMGKESIENSHPIIHPIAGATKNGSTENMIDYMDGFGRGDSSWQASNMVDALQAGTGSAVNALEYSKKGLNIYNIARSIAENLEKNNATSAILYGYSVGGDVALLVANELIHKFDVCVSTAYLDHTPAGIKDINSDQRNMASAVINTLDLFNEFGIKLQYSSIARSIVNANIPDDTTFINNVSSSLIIDQFNLGASIDVQESINKLKSDKCPTPVVIYVSSSNPKSDQVVNLVQSEMAFEEAANAANVPFTTLYVEGSTHGRPDLDKSYNKVLLDSRPAINDMIIKSENIHAIQSSTEIRTRILFHQ